MSKLFHQPVDAIPTSIVTGGVLLALVPFFVHLPTGMVAAIVVASVLARFIAPVHHHGHAHRRVFRVSFLNGLYDLVLVLAAGYTTAGWELQHVLGHHQMHLDPRHDVAGVQRFSEGGRWQRLVFTVAGDLLSTSDSIRIALRQNPRKRRALLTRFSVQLAQQAVAIGILLTLDVKLTLVLFVLPAVLLRWMTFWASFAQHEGVPAEDVYSGSVTNLGPMNAVLLNVGHHTAHHERPTLHWSLLPQRTDEILQRIPASCLRNVPERRRAEVTA